MSHTVNRKVTNPLSLVAGNLSCIMIPQKVQAKLRVREVKFGD